MRRLVLLVVVGCSSGTTSSGVSEPTRARAQPDATPAVLELGLLIGSWSAWYDDGQHKEVQLDIREDGGFAAVHYYAERPLCVATGRVALVWVEESWDRRQQGYTDLIRSISFEPDLDTCEWSGTFAATPLVSLDADRFEYGPFVFHSQEGPLVAPELIAELERISREVVATSVPSPDEPDGPDVPDEPYVPDPEVARMKATAAELTARMGELGYFRVNQDDIMWSASWDQTPYVIADLAYELAVLVPSGASDARAYLEMDGEVLEMNRYYSDDGEFIVLRQYATIGSSGFRTRDDGGLTVRYTSSYDEPSILLVLQNQNIDQ